MLRRPSMDGRWRARAHAVINDVLDEDERLLAQLRMSEDMLSNPDGANELLVPAWRPLCMREDER